jgi:hypothetical protein
MAFLHLAAHAVILAEVVDHEHLAARTADPFELAHHLNGIGHHGQHIHGHDDVEGIVGESHVAGIHFEDRLDMVEPVPDDPPAGLFQHLRRQVDPGDLQAPMVVRQRHAGAHANLEDPALVLVDVLHRAVAPRFGNAPEGDVVDRGPARIGALRTAPSSISMILLLKRQAPPTNRCRRGHACRPRYDRSVR